MIGTSFVDEIDCGSFFDNIDDLMEDVDSVLGPAPDCDSAFPSSLWPAHSGASLPAPEAAVFSGNGDSDFSSELPVPVSHSFIVQSVSYLACLRGGTSQCRSDGIAVNGDVIMLNFSTDFPFLILNFKF